MTACQLALTSFSARRSSQPHRLIWMETAILNLEEALVLLGRHQVGVRHPLPVVGIVAGSERLDGRLCIRRKPVEAVEFW